MLNTKSIKEYNPNINGVFAFRIDGEVSGDDLESMAKRMNDVFDGKDELDMLIAFDNYKGSETTAGLNLEVIRAQFRSLSSVRNYCVAQAPDNAKSVIEFFDNLIPVEAKTFGSEHNALEFLRAQPAVN